VSVIFGKDAEPSNMRLFDKLYHGKKEVQPES